MRVVPLRLHIDIKFEGKDWVKNGPESKVGWGRGRMGRMGGLAGALEDQGASGGLWEGLRGSEG